MVFIKLEVRPGVERTEVLQLVDIFRARVIDNSDRTLTLSVTGDAGKVNTDDLPVSHMYINAAAPDVGKTAPLPSQ